MIRIFAVSTRRRALAEEHRLAFRGWRQASKMFGGSPRRRDLAAAWQVRTPHDHRRRPLALDRLRYEIFRPLLLLSFVVLGCNKSSKPTSGEGDSSSDRPSVAYVTNGVASFWTIAESGVKQGAKEFDADAQVLMPAEGSVTRSG